MTQQIGSLGNDGAPRLKILLSGVFSQTPQEFEAIIDTGFSGFVCMPLLHAFPLGLPLFGTSGVTVADGRSSYKLTAQVIAQLGDVKKIGVVILEPNSNDVLIGIDFLRTFEKALFIHTLRPTVVLEDCKVLDEAISIKAADLAPAKGPDDKKAEP